MKVVQIWYKRKARPAKPLSLRLCETTKSSIPVAGSNEVDRLIYFGKDDMAELEKYESGQDIGVVDLLKIIMGEL